MTKQEKLIERFLTKPKDFTWNELVKLLNYFGYGQVSVGKTGGSRRAFIQKQTKHIIRLHKPHPEKILKRYQIDEMIDELTKKGLI